VRPTLRPWVQEIPCRRSKPRPIKGPDAARVPTPALPAAPPLTLPLPLPLLLALLLPSPRPLPLPLRLLLALAAVLLSLSHSALKPMR